MEPDFQNISRPVGNFAGKYRAFTMNQPPGCYAIFRTDLQAKETLEGGGGK